MYTCFSYKVVTHFAGYADIGDETFWSPCCRVIASKPSGEKVNAGNISVLKELLN